MSLYPKIVNFTAKLTGLLTDLLTIFTSKKRHCSANTKTHLISCNRQCTLISSSLILGYQPLCKATKSAVTNRFSACILLILDILLVVLIISQDVTITPTPAESKSGRMSGSALLHTITGITSPFGLYSSMKSLVYTHTCPNAKNPASGLISTTQ